MKTKYMADMLSGIRKQKPSMPEHIVKKIIAEGCRQISKQLLDFKDVRLDSPAYGVKFTIFRYNPKLQSQRFAKKMRLHNNYKAFKARQKDYVMQQIAQGNPNYRLYSTKDALSKTS